MTVTVEHGPNADMIPTFATNADSHRRAWRAIAASAERRIDAALADLEEEALTVLQGRPSNLGHLLTLAVGAAESAIASAQLDLDQARKHVHG